MNIRAELFLVEYLFSYIFRRNLGSFIPISTYFPVFYLQKLKNCQNLAKKMLLPVKNLLLFLLKQNPHLSFIFILSDLIVI